MNTEHLHLPVQDTGTITFLNCDVSNYREHNRSTGTPAETNFSLKSMLFAMDVGDTDSGSYAYLNLDPTLNPINYR